MGEPAAMTGMASAPAPASTIRQFKVEKGRELIIEGQTPLMLRLLSGSAQIYGNEMPPQIWMSFPPDIPLAVLTWGEATIEVDGNAETYYRADEVCVCGNHDLPQDRILRIRALHNAEILLNNNISRIRSWLVGSL